MDSIDKSLIKTHLISIIMENAKNLGWSVEKQTSKVYVLRKNICDLTKEEENTKKLIDLILDIRYMKKIENVLYPENPIAFLE